MRYVLVLVLLLSFTLPALAGEIFGTVTEGGKAVPAGVKVTIAAGRRATKGRPTSSDPTGSS